MEQHILDTGGIAAARIFLALLIVELVLAIGNAAAISIATARVSRAQFSRTVITGGLGCSLMRVGLVILAPWILELRDLPATLCATMVGAIALTLAARGRRMKPTKALILMSIVTGGLSIESLLGHQNPPGEHFTLWICAAIASLPTQLILAKYLAALVRVCRVALIVSAFTLGLMAVRLAFYDPDLRRICEAHPWTAALSISLLASCLAAANCRWRGNTRRITA